MAARIVCTIASKRHLPLARVTARSFARWHPGETMVVLLADRPGPADAGQDEPFELLALEELCASRPELIEVAGRYDELQFSYALTPVLIAHLLESGFDQVIFIKQESFVTGPLDAVFSLLGGGDWIALTPHLISPPPGDDAVDRELNILQGGVFNGGLVGVRSDPRTKAFLEWWWARLQLHCRWDLESGLHWEQRWLDLVPSLFGDVGVIRDTGCNVGHWNVTERPIELVSGEVWVSGKRASLIRFSGFDADRPERLTRYNERVDIARLDGADEVLAEYRQALLDEGLDAAAAEKYGFERQTPEIAPELRPTGPGASAEGVGRSDSSDDSSALAAGVGPRKPRTLRRRVLRHLRCRFPRGTVVCTIAGSSYESRVLALRDSLHSWHPELPLVVKRIVDGESIEVAGAMKAPLIAQLLRAGWDEVIYLDADTFVTGPLDHLLGPLRGEASVVLTPHLVRPAGEGAAAAGIEMLLCSVGTLNAGAVGVAASPSGLAFVDWWAARTASRCDVDIAAGVANDQRWLDLAPIFFDGTEVLRDAGFNVGYWNLIDSQMSIRNGQPELDGRRVSLMHFSGFDPDRPSVVSRYTPDLLTSQIGPAGEGIFGRYAAAIREQLPGAEG
jgi:hypothetical protein